MSLALLFLKAYSHVKNSMLKAHIPVSERAPRLLRKILKVRIMNLKRPRTWLRTSNMLNKSPKPDEVVVVWYDASTLGEKMKLPRKVKEWPSLGRWWLPRKTMHLPLEDAKASAPSMPSSNSTTMLSSPCTSSRQPFAKWRHPFDPLIDLHTSTFFYNATSARFQHAPDPKVMQGRGRNIRCS